MSEETTGKAKGGKAAAALLTPEQKKERAQKAAAARWSNPNPKLLKATHEGVIKLGDKELNCAVLEDGTRILSRNAIFRAYERTKRGRKKDEVRVLNMPSFIDANNLQAFIGEDLRGELIPIEYISLQGRVATGYRAAILPMLCDVYLAARDSASLTKSQLPLATISEILVRSLSKVGIMALIDEATGHQEVRPKDALQSYLEMLVRKELAAWMKKFPDEFFENIYKLKGWHWPGMQKNRFSVVSYYIRNLVYERISPGLLKELESKSPKDEKGKRKNKLHQWLTEDVGDPMLAQHLHSLIMFQRLAIANGFGWNRFLKMVDQVLPKRGSNLEFDFMNEALPIVPEPPS